MLFDMTKDPDVADACDGVEFKNKPTTVADSVIDSILEQRKKDRPLYKYTEDSDIMPYIMSLLQYCVPWAVLFIFSIIGL